MKNLFKILPIAALIIFSCSTETNNENALSEENSLLEKKETNTYEQRIFSVTDFKSLTKTKGTVFNKLSETTINEFVKELKFGINGEPATAIYTSIEKELSKEDQAVFWSYFGYRMDFILDTDHKGYKCESPHNCKINSQYICMTGC